MCTGVVGTIGNKLGLSLSESAITKNQVVCHIELQQSLSFHISDPKTFVKMDFLKSAAVSSYMAVPVSKRYMYMAKFKLTVNKKVTQ